MGKRDGLAKALAVLGVVLVALPLLAPFAFGALRAATRPPEAPMNFDYLMPFEIYPVALVGAALLLVASLRARARRAGVGWSIGGMLGGVVLGAIAAKVTGIADSVETLPAWRYVPTIALGAGSLIAQVVLIVFGVMLLRDLFASHRDATPAVPAV